MGLFAPANNATSAARSVQLTKPENLMVVVSSANGEFGAFTLNVNATIVDRLNIRERETLILLREPRRFQQQNVIRGKPQLRVSEQTPSAPR